MNPNDLISSFTDTIIIIASESNGKDPETQRRLLIQVIPFFKEILSNITPKFKNIAITKKATSQFLIATSDSLHSFLLSKEDTKQLTEFLQVLVTSCLAEQCPEELTRLMTSLISVQDDPENLLSEFIPFIEKYFQNPNFREFFINGHGFETAWCAFFIEKSNILLPMFFDQFAVYPTYFVDPKFRTPLENLLNTISSSLIEMPYEKCELIVTKLFVLCHERPKEFYDIYEKVGMFNAICKFLFAQKEDVKREFFVSYFITFSTLVPFEINSRPNKPILILIDVICDPKCSKELRKLCLGFFIRLTDQRRNPFMIDKISQIAVSIPHDDTESIISFSVLCYNLQVNLNFDLSPIIPTLVQFCTFDLMVTIDLHKLLLVFIHTERAFSPFISSFFIPLFEGLDSEKVVKLFNQYNELYILFTHFVGGHLSKDEMVPLLQQFLTALPFFEDQQKANAVFWDSLLAKKGYMFINIYLTSIREIMKTSMETAEHTFSLLIKCALTNTMCCLKCISDKSIEIVLRFYSEFNFSSKLILNFISAVTMHRFIAEFDEQVSTLFQQYDYLNETPDNLLYLALGLQIGQEKNGASLCFPSILHRCTPYEFTSPFDLWLCAQISLDLFLKTNNDITAFPSIVNVARQYIQPKHSEMIIQNPSLLERIFKGTFSHIPLFEFPPLKCEVTFDIPLYDTFKSLSFWLYISDTNQSSTTILTLNSSSLSIREDKMFFEGKQIANVTKNQWLFLVFTCDDNNCYNMFLNNEQVHSFNGKSCHMITFGSKYNTSKWFIGGSIRIFKEVLTKNKMKNISSQGAKSIHQTGYKETLIYSPYDIIPLFKQTDLNTINTTRPVTIYSLYNYIKRSLRGSTPFYTQCIQMIDDSNKINDIKSLVSIICSIQKLKISGWSNSEFSLFMSTIFNICPQIADRLLIDSVSNCFIDETNEEFDWESFFNFTLDYSFFFSDISIHIISLFFQFNVRFPIQPNTPLNNMFTNFLLSLVILPDIKKEYLLNIYDLLQIHCKDPSQIIRAIISYPDFGKDLQDYSSPYEMKKDETVKNLLDIYLSLPVTSFTEFYILRLFEVNDSFKILEHIIKNNINRMDEAFETYKIISFCFENIFCIQSWEIVLSIFLKRVIRLDDIDIDCSDFNPVYFANLLRFLVPLVFVASRLNPTNFWNRLCVKLLNVAIEQMNSCNNIDTKIQSLILLMMTLGVKTQKECIFPPGPTLHSTEEVIEYSVNRGQIFPEISEEEEENKEEIEPLFTATREVIYNLSKFAPSTLVLTPNNEIQMDLKLKELSYVITEKQFTDDNISNWDDYLKRLYHQFGIEEVSEFDIENSNIVPHLSQLIIQVFQKQPNIIENILITSTIFPSKLSVYWMQHLSIETLQLPNSKDICGISLITFVCDRLLEGWYSSLFLIILSSIFSILQKMHDVSYSNSFYLCILYSMDLVHSNQVSMLGDLFVEYENVILRPEFYEKLKYVKIFISRGISLIPFLNSTFSTFWLKFLDLIESSDNFISKWKKKVHDIDFNKVLVGLRILGKDGFVEYTNHKNLDPEFWETFDSFLQQVTKSNMNSMKKSVLNNLNQLVQKRQESNKLIISIMMNFLVKENSFRTYSRAIASSVRYFSRRCLLTRCELFLRKREHLISTFIPFDKSKSDRYSLTILSDPIYPSRRKILSPLEYVAPDYPSGTSDIIFEYHPSAMYEYSRFPECVSCCLSSCRYRIPSILRRSPKAIHARFAESLPVLPNLCYQIFLCICNDGKKFDYSCDCSLLYGVDVIEGTLFINSKNLIFLEGDKIVEGDKMFHVHSDECRISQEIYMQFFQSGLLAPKIFTFLGHFAIVTEIQQIISATNHLWIQRPYSVALNYSMGYNFVLNFNNKTYSDAMYYINKGVSRFMESAPSDSPYISPIRSARLASENLRKLTSMWLEGSLDNFTYLSVINRFGKRCFADLTQYPVFPWVISDYASETFPPLVQPKKNQPQPSSSTQESNLKKFHSQDITTDSMKSQDQIEVNEFNTYDPNDTDNESDSIQQDESNGPYSLQPKSTSSKTHLLSSIRSFFTSNESCSDAESDIGIMDSTDVISLNENESENETESANDNEIESSSSLNIHSNAIVDKSIYRDLTKPMGQLGEERAKKFDQIYEDSEHLYYYGTHYLHFGVVIYFMFRIDPFSVYSFILHHGWDHPNRIFLKVNETWLSASMKSQSDVKELIPQMYKVPDYLTNVSHFNFETQYDSNINVDNVELPKWAKNGRHFIQVMCKFLESKYVTRHLNSWIDLIFGVNSRGQGAINTKNIFHPTCYPESANIHDDNEDYVDKQAKVTSIINFGQISPQVFGKAHPQSGKERKRRSSMNTNYEAVDLMVNDGKNHLLSNVNNLVFQRINCDCSDSRIQDFVLSSSEIIFASTVDSTNSSFSKIHLSSFRESFSASNQPLSNPPQKTYSSTINLISKSSISTFVSRKRNAPPLPVPNLSLNAISSSTNSIGNPNNMNSTLSSADTSTQNSPRSQDPPVLSVLTHAVVLPSLQTHKVNDQTISSISLSRDGFLLCKAYIDGHVLVSRLSYTRNGTVYSNETDVAHFHTSLGLGVCDISSEHFVCFVSCGTDVLMFDIGAKRPIMPSIKLDFKVSHIAIDDEAAVVWLTGGSKITLCTISGDVLFSTTLHSEITSIYASPLPEYVHNRFTLVGHADGTVSFINFSYRRMLIYVMHKVKIADDPIVLIKAGPKCQRAIAVCSDNNVYDFEFIGSSIKPLDAKYTYECANCKSPIKSGYCCSCCHRFLCSKCVAKDSIKGVKVIHFCHICNPAKHHKQNSK